MMNKWNSMGTTRHAVKSRVLDKPMPDKYNCNS